ncbi:MAG: hypothetical protein HYV27_15830 [Candidatus Hydrogenedentes bacterium]|nr:hypothetical protein [Candidatus Hydrogenedentota bacterium]
MVLTMAVAALLHSCSRDRAQTPLEGDMIVPLASTLPSPEVQVANPPDKVFIATSEALTPEEERASFTAPPGFEVQLVAAEPAIQKPMQLAFDEKGRLLVSGSRDYPLGPGEGEAPGDSLLLLEIDGESGAATKISTFSTGYTICSGVAALPGGRVILGHAPDILLLTDADGDGVADGQEVLYTGFARTDTHELPNSFTWGADGWLYGLQGHVNVSDVRDRNGTVTAIHHGNVYRMRPDGSAMEVFAPGMSNPWGLVFDNAYNLFAADCESRPLWEIVQGLPYQGFLQPEEPLGYAPFITEDPHGASGFAGLVSYSDRAFPAAWQGALFLGNPINGIIHGDRPTPNGATHAMTRLPDFLTSTDPWFRPVDVELGPDGALYVADWYNRIVAHVEVPLNHPGRDKERGRIWRVVYRGVGGESEEEEARMARQFRGPMATDWSVAPKKVLLHALGESNAWIRNMAAAQLRHRFAGAFERPCRRLLRDGTVPMLARCEAFWLLEGAGAITATDVEKLTQDGEPQLRRLAARWLGEHASPEGAVMLAGMLGDTAPIVAREAALGLRGAPSDASLQALQTVWEGDGADPLLQYARLFSMREHLKEDAILNNLIAQTPERATRLRAAIAATPTASAVRVQTAWLAEGRIPAAMRGRVLENVLLYGDGDAIQKTFTAEAGPDLAVYVQALLKNTKRAAAAGIDTTALMRAWFGRLSESADAESRLLALEVALRDPFPAALPLARRTAPDRGAAERMRQAAANLWLTLDGQGAASEVAQLAMAPEEGTAMRKLFALELGKRAVDAARFDALIAALKTAPAEVRAGMVNGLVSQRPGIDLLFESVAAGATHPGLINTVEVTVHIEYIHKDAALRAWHARLTEGVEAETNQAAELVAQFGARFAARTEHDLRRGQELVEENCLVCHRIGGIGGLRAPNLDGVGARGIERVLQDILLPGKDIDPAFRSTRIVLKDGRVEEGFVLKEDAERLVLIDATEWESEIDLAEIAERKPVWVSPMPADFGATLAEDDFMNVVAFLLHPPQRIVPLTEKWKGPHPE